MECLKKKRQSSVNKDEVEQTQSCGEQESHCCLLVNIYMGDGQMQKENWTSVLFQKILSPSDSKLWVIIFLRKTNSNITHFLSQRTINATKNINFFIILSVSLDHLYRLESIVRDYILTIYDQ